MPRPTAAGRCAESRTTNGDAACRSVACLATERASPTERECRVANPTYCFTAAEAAFHFQTVNSFIGLNCEPPGPTRPQRDAERAARPGRRCRVANPTYCFTAAEAAFHFQTVNPFIGLNCEPPGPTRLQRDAERASRPERRCRVANPTYRLLRERLASCLRLSTNCSACLRSSTFGRPLFSPPKNFKNPLVLRPGQLNSPTMW